MGRKSIEKERKVLRKKQQKWLAKALPFFYKNGITNPTMNEIADYLGLSKATIYNYYESKDELVYDSLWTKLKEMDKFKDLLFDERLDYIERYFEGVKFATRSLMGMTEIYLNDLKNHYPKCWESIALYKEKSVENLKLYYQNGIDRGIFRTFNVDVMASYDLAFFDMMINPEFLVKNNVRIQTAFYEYFNMKFNGILVERNLSYFPKHQSN
jgi:AcrR family transcriptional regulator